MHFNILFCISRQHEICFKAVMQFICAILKQHEIVSQQAYSIVTVDLSIFKATYIMIGPSI